MKTLAMLLGLAAAASARQAPGQEAPVPPAAGLPEPARRDPKISTRLGFEAAYDDNILHLKNKQIDQLKDGSRPEKFRIDEPDDFVYSPWAEVDLKAWIGSEPTRFGLRIQPFYYQENPIANYQEYTLTLDQDLGRDRLGMEFKLEQDVYHRELEIRIPGPNLWESAFYSELDAELHYDASLAETVRAGLFGGFRRRDFDVPFNFRDRQGYFLGVQSSVEILPDWTLEAKYEYADLEADAIPTQADTSYSHHSFELRTAVSLLERDLKLSLRHRFAFRDYTTSNDPAFDPDHVDREDLRQRTILAARVKVAKGWAVDFSYIFRNLDSDRPFDTGDTAEAVGYRQQVFLIGITVKL